MKDADKTNKQLIYELTELRLQDEALKNSESPEKYRSLVEDIRDVIYELDSQGVVLYVSPAVRDMLGFDSTEIIGKNFTELAHKDDLSRLAEWFSELRKGKESSFEYRVSDKSGEIKWAQTRTRPIMEDGALRGARGILIDVTAQKRAEEALRETNETLSTIVKSSPLAIIALDVDGNVIRWNAAAEEMFGWLESEALGHPLPYVSEDNRDEHLKLRERVLRGEGFTNVEAIRRKKDGSYIDISISTAPLRDSQGRVTGIMSINANISERKQAEKALKESENKYRMIAENMMDVITIMDMNLRLTYVSPSILHMRGYTDKEAMTQSLEQIMTPESLLIIARVFEEEMQREASGTADPNRVRTLELEEYRKDMSTIWLEVSLSFLRDADRRPIGILSLSHDISERKQAEETLRESEESLRSYLEYAPDGVYMIDLEGNFLYGNLKYEEIIGYRREELIGKNFLKLNLLPEKSLNKAAQLLQASIEGKSTGPDEIKLISKEGRIIPVEISTSVVQQRGQRIVLSFVRDITERKRAEEALRLSEEKYRWILNNMADVITVMDMNLRFIYVSPSILHMRGYTAEEAVTQTFEQVMTPESLLISAKVFEEEMKLEASGTADPDRIRIVEVEQYRKDGSLVLMENHLSFMRDGAKKPVGIISVSHDITARKRAEEALLANRAQLANALEMARLGHWEYDVANDLFTFNDQFYRMFHTTAEQVGGYTMRSSEYARRFVHPDDIEVVREEIRKAIETTDPHFTQQMEHRMVYPDGTVGYITVRFFIIKDSHGRTVKTYGVNQDITDRKQAEKQLQDTLKSLRKAVGATIQVMASAVEAKDPYTAGHQIRSADLARAIALEMGLPKEKIEGIRVASSIHDIGKLSIPAEILSKPTKLSEIEFALIKEHAQKGFEMLKDVESPWPLAEIVHQHHERMDGSGYPRHLKGEEILMEARILAVADVVEAMASHRPYRPGLGIDAALKEIEKNKGIFYDDAVADACLRLFREKGFQLAVS